MTLGAPFNGTRFVTVGSSAASALGTFRLDDPYPNYVTPSNVADVRTQKPPVMLPLPDGTHDDVSARILYYVPYPIQRHIAALVFPEGTGAASGDPDARPVSVPIAHPAQEVQVNLLTPFGGLLYTVAPRPEGGYGLFRFMPNRLNHSVAPDWEALVRAGNATAEDMVGGSLTLVGGPAFDWASLDMAFRQVLRVAFGRLFFVGNAPNSSESVVWALDREMDAARSYVPQVPYQVLAAAPSESLPPVRSVTQLQATTLSGAPATKGWSMNGNTGAAEAGWLWFVGLRPGAYFFDKSLFRIRVDGPEVAGAQGGGTLPGLPELVQNRLDGEQAALVANGTDVDAGVLNPVRVEEPDHGDAILPFAGSVAVVGSTGFRNQGDPQLFYVIPDSPAQADS